jgi:hypothetical protein
MLFCGSVLANDITGEYRCSNNEGKIIIKSKGNNEYLVNISTYDSGRTSFFTEFEGTGKFIGDILIVRNQQKVYDTYFEKGIIKEKSTYKIINAVLKIYMKRHPDVINNNLGLGIEKMNDSQIAIIDEPTFTEGENTTALFGSDIPHSLKFFNEGASGGPGLTGLYTKKISKKKK